MLKLGIIFFITHLILLKFVVSLEDETPEIETNDGKIVGKVITVLGQKVNVFRGIPFAKPPVKTLRFKKSEPGEKWKNTLYAFENKPACIQIKNTNMPEKSFEMASYLGENKPVGGALGLALELKNLSESEDCLYMNLYVPGDIDLNNEKTVIMVIHGGLFYCGGANVPSFDGSFFASLGDVIVAVIQYRLGVLGFLHGGIQEIPGNLGLYDQRLAMIWLKNNIKAFGGNPKNLVLLGFDAGGWSVGFHLLSPGSQNLFKRAIMQSGSALTPLMLFGETTAINRFDMFLSASNCLSKKHKNDKKAFQKTIGKTLTCLQNLSVEAIQNSQNKVLMYKKDIGFFPSEDKFFFKGNPFDLVKAGKMGNVKEILLGTNSNEGGIMLATAFSETYPPVKGEPKPLNLHDLIEFIKNTEAKANAGQIQMILPMFFRGIDKKDPVAVRIRMLELIRDGIFVCPDLMFITSFVKYKGVVYYYNFKHRPSNSLFSKWMEGAQHGDEMQFVFGMPLKPEYASNYTEKEKELSRLMIKVWSNYAKYGNTNVENVKWKPTIQKEKFYASITETGFQTLKGFPKNLCKNLLKYYPMGQSFLRTYKPW